MGRRPKTEAYLARFPRLREIRERQLGWEVIDLVARLPGNRPSVASIYRIEKGQPVRISNARRIFDVLNEALERKLDAEQELVVEPATRPGRTKGK